MKDKVCVITGATSGIGLSAAGRLAKLGAILVLVCRNPQKGEAAIAKITEETGNNNLEMVVADLSVQSEIRKAAAEITSKHTAISVLINNAGLALTTRAVTSDGIEMTFAVNHLAYFLLTHLLLDQLKTAAPSRVINVSSEAHRNVVLELDNLQSEKSYTGFRAYSISKMCNVLFTYELAKRLDGTGVTVNALHPGYLNTGIFRDAPAFLQFIVKLTAGNAEKGGAAIVNLATNPDLAQVSGKYFDGTREIHSSSSSYDPQLSAQVWEISSKLTHL